jgi:uncharacterized protein DUF6632
LNKEDLPMSLLEAPNEVREVVERGASEATDAEEGLNMSDVNLSNANRLRYLRVVLVVVGLIFIFGIYTLGIVWPSGWVWGEAGAQSFIPSHYLMMIIGVYATLGVFLIIASKNPAAHVSLIWFTVWSSFVHAGIMAVQALTDGKEHYHLGGDVPALLVVAIVLAVLTPRGRVAQD